MDETEGPRQGPAEADGQVVADGFPAVAAGVAEPASSAEAPAPTDGAHPIPDEGPAGAASGAEAPPVVPLVVTPELRTVLAWSDIAADEGEDELEAFPIPGDEETEVAEPEVVPELGAEAPPAAEAAAVVPVAPMPAAPLPTAAPVEVVPSAAGTGGGGARDGGGTGAAAGAGGGPRRRWFGLLDIVDRPMTIFEHLDELRRRLMWAVIAFVVGTAGSFAFVRQILDYTERPLLRYGGHLQMLAPMESLFATIRIAAIGGLLIASPVILYQLVMYILPALTRQERIILFSYLPATVVLFVAGLCFGYFVFEPIALRVSLTFLPGIVTAPSLSNWVSFLVNYSLPFGVLFELPVFVVVLTRLGILSSATLAKGRRFAIFGSVVVAVMFAPPGDFIFTPSLIALPIIALYEISIQAARVVERRRRALEA
jgi:sec-independent protein translocase protein TatC